jgi:hypothetical protein
MILQLALEIYDAALCLAGRGFWYYRIVEHHLGNKRVL